RKIQAENKMVEIPYTPEDPRSIRLLFTRIARKYDRTNHVISLGFDILWRKKFSRLFLSHKRIADICCGSGAMLPLLGSRVAAGLCFTREMLRVASFQSPAAKLVEGDAQRIPLQSASFDAAVIVYSVRNIPDVPRMLKEVHRILEPGGLFGILDFGVPEG